MLFRSGLDLHACIDEKLVLRPQAPAVLISAGIALRIGDPEWCALVLPRSGLGHREGLVLGNAVGVIDADYEGACLVSAWNRNPVRSGDDAEGIVIMPGDRNTIHLVDGDRVEDWPPMTKREVAARLAERIAAAIGSDFGSPPSAHIPGAGSRPR